MSAFSLFYVERLRRFGLHPVGEFVRIEPALQVGIGEMILHILLVVRTQQVHLASLGFSRDGSRWFQISNRLAFPAQHRALVG